MRFFSPENVNLSSEKGLDRRYCYTRKANFTFGASDKMDVLFKTNKKFRARYRWCVWRVVSFHIKRK